MTPHQYRILMQQWREDLKYILGPPQPQAPDLWQRDNLMVSRRNPNETVFQGRVARRLRERGWVMKEIAFVWGVTTGNVAKMIRSAG